MMMVMAQAQLQKGRPASSYMLSSGGTVPLNQAQQQQQRLGAPNTFTPNPPSSPHVQNRDTRVGAQTQASQLSQGQLQSAQLTQAQQVQQAQQAQHNAILQQCMRECGMAERDPSTLTQDEKVWWYVKCLSNVMIGCSYRYVQRKDSSSHEPSPNGLTRPGTTLDDARVISFQQDEFEYLHY